MPTQTEEHVSRLVSLGRVGKRRHDLVGFIGRHKGFLIDNVKYLYLYAATHDCGFESFFFTYQAEEYHTLRRRKLPVCNMDSAAVKLLSTAGVIVLDDMPHNLFEPYCLGIGAKKIQLWHGIPLKKIGFPEIESNVNMTPEKAEQLNFSYSGQDVVVSTSPWVTENLFSKVFRADKFIEYGYPRNDILLRPAQKFDLLNVDMNMHALLRQHRRSGGKVAVYMPTFRDNGNDFMDEQGNFVLDLIELSRFAQQHNLIFVFKLHPYMETLSLKTNLPGILAYPTAKDIYPILPLADLLITDYSSVYFDYLLLNRPIHFFIYDHQRYLTCNRELFFDFNSITPGPAATTQTELLEQLLHTLQQEHDPYAGQRQDLCRKLFSYRDAGASERITRHIKYEMLAGLSP